VAAEAVPATSRSAKRTVAGEAFAGPGLSVDADDDLRARSVQGFLLQPLDRLTPDLAVQVTRTRPPLEPCERRLVGCSSGADDEAATPRRPRRTERDRLRRPPDDDAGHNPSLHLDLVEEDRALRSGSGGE